MVLELVDLRIRQSLTDSKNGSKTSSKLSLDFSVRIAGKAAAALPGIIGSIITGVLDSLKKVVTAAAGHVWIFLSSLATLIGYTIYQHINSPDRKKRRN